MERLLLLSPPSLAARPEKLNNIIKSHGEYTTDLQMIDRLASGLVSLPESTYDVVMLLTDVNAAAGSIPSLGRTVIQSVVRALRPGGKLTCDSEPLATADYPDRTDLILSGLIFDSPGHLSKPSFNPQEVVPLRSIGKAPATTNGTGPGVVLPKASENPTLTYNSGVGTESEDELIDEETLLDQEDMGRPIIQPPECRPKAGKRRRACKDCTCGLAERLQEEDKAKRANADSALETMKLESNDLAEVDFTVQGKLGSCGNCALGDAFRCDGCPFIGLPPFKPGEEVTILNNDIQL